MSRSPTAVAVVSLDELREVVASAVALALSQKEASAKAGGQVLSAREAAKRAKRRAGDVLAALEDGSLPGRRNGRRWSVKAADVDTWAMEARS